MINWTKMSSPRVTVIMPTWMGDVCMATPTLQSLRSILPEDAHITAAMRPGMKALLCGHPAIDELVDINPGGVLGPWRAGRVLAATHADVIVVLPGSFRTALAARLAGGCRRIGYARDGRRWLLSDAVAPPDRTEPVSTVDWYHGLITDAAPGLPSLVVTEDDHRAAKNVLREQPLAYMLLVPGANRNDKRWSASRFAAVSNAAHEQYGWTTVIAGSPDERALTSTVAQQCVGPVIDLPARGSSIGALKAITAGAELVISNDTGPRHVAIALGTPVITLFGPTDHRWTHMDAADEIRLLAEPFLPRNLVADACHKVCRIDRISVADVLQAIESWQRPGGCKPILRATT